MELGDGASGGGAGAWAKLITNQAVGWKRKEERRSGETRDVWLASVNRGLRRHARAQMSERCPRLVDGAPRACLWLDDQA